MAEIVCPACSAVNRVPPEKSAAEARCGKCHGALFDGQPVALDSRGFTRQVGRSSIPVVVDFWAEWCGPCKSMAPEFAKAAAALEPTVRFAKLDTEEAQDVAAKFGIRSIPTMILFHGGREVARQSGAMPAGHITQWLRESLRA